MKGARGATRGEPLPSFPSLPARFSDRAVVLETKFPGAAPAPSALHAEPMVTPPAGAKAAGRREGTCQLQGVRSLGSCRNSHHGSAEREQGAGKVSSLPLLSP